ncbi:MAG TPA: hypothetical protein VKU41_08295, partial [Polyangiaceae bacterium]|nr:hypothetical protein [Polyangiaceae bacterium]
PADTWALARLFPVLRRVPDIRDLPDQPIGDPQSVRRRAFLALRQLLLTLSRRQPLVVFIDDMQWGDTDSAALLLELMRPPHAPGVLLVMTHREEEAEASSCLNEVYGRWPEGADVRDLHVGALEPGDARRLASTLLQVDPASSLDSRASRDSTAALVARESGGNPFLIEELVRGVAGAREAAAHPAVTKEADPAAVATVGVDRMVRDRLARLPNDARTLVEVIAVSGRPLPVSQVAEAAGIGAGADEAIALLRSRRFVRTGLREGHEVAETIHDRIRETIVAQLPASVVVDHHRRLARVLEAAPVRDAEALAIHLLGAGEKERAAEYAERAAEHAAAKLAFDQAVRLLRVTLECTAPASPDARRLRMRIAEVLEWAGRSAEAALVYFDAAKDAPTLERLDLERASAEQLLACGRIDEGIEVLYRVLASVGLRPPKSVLAALLWIVLYRVVAALFRPHPRIRASDGVSPLDRVRIDALYSLALGISAVDVVRGSALQARHLHIALRAGDRFRVLRAMVLESTQLAGIGGPVTKREAWLMQEASKLAGDDDNSEGMVFLRGASGVGHFLRGRWRKASEVLDRAYARFPFHRAGWHSNANLFRVQALYFAGEIAELARRGPQLLADAEQRGDLYVAVNLRTRAIAGVCLAQDEPEDARRQIHESLAQWSHSGFLVQHWQAMIYEVEIDLYLGDGKRAYERLHKDLPALRSSFLLSLQVIRALTTFGRGRCAVARMEAEPRRRKPLLAEARRALRSLRREGLPWTESLATMLSAIVANASGDREGAASFLRRAIELADQTDMGLHLAAIRYRLGEVVGGAEGDAALREATEAMAKEGVRSPGRTAARLLPGRWEARERTRNTPLETQ